jgi:hypothetical protein
LVLPYFFISFITIARLFIENRDRCLFYKKRREIIKEWINSGKIEDINKQQVKNIIRN